ncbi:amidohydrolase family protein [Tritonibacter mobilis]|nr:amidohydrolase family protein [Tritonibacter mobilis]
MLGTHLKLGLMSLCAATVAMGAAAQDVADTIYTGGPVLTMDDSAPRAEALAVREGRIAAVGSLEAVMALRGESTRVIDLEGAALLPGFVDAHGHVAAIGLQAMAANLLPAPDGRGNSIAELQDILRDFIDAQPERVERFGAVIGFGYDDSQLSELAHPTRHDLDAVAADIPVYIVHQSGHLAVANTAALALAGITAESEEMPGGVIRREADGKTPDGVLEETPHFVALGRDPRRA